MKLAAKAGDRSGYRLKDRLRPVGAERAIRRDRKSSTVRSPTIVSIVTTASWRFRGWFPLAPLVCRLAEYDRQLTVPCLSAPTALASMHLAKEIAVAAYYHATLPWRWVAQSQRRRTGQAPICVLFYHRVADHHANDWTITTTDFSKHIDWMKQHVEFVSLAEAQARIASGTNERVAVGITFDDGYADNYDFAIPLLLAEGIPCTYFVSLDFVLTGRPFPHDVQAGQPLAVNTVEQLREMAAAGVQIGAHTRSHRDLGNVAAVDIIYDEIVLASQELSELIGTPIRYFAFPYGLPENLNRKVVEFARAYGLAGVCSAYGAYNFPGQDAYHIQRIHGDPELIRLKNWLTVDPRKLPLGQGFEMPAPAPSGTAARPGVSA